MPDITIVYWRDIPAQVIVGKGRNGSKRQLTERFEQAIDRAAMRADMVGTDDYLTEWRKGGTYSLEGDPEMLAQREAARLETEYTPERIRALVNNYGRT
tara:strand:+ start:2137 stop:2433 length:297 start_codon:yes stop_codon:yes gene_type:complete